MPGSQDNDWSLATRTVHHPPAHLPSPPVATPLFQSSAFRAEHATTLAGYAEAVQPPAFYTRWGNPTTEVWEKVMADLEGGRLSVKVQDPESPRLRRTVRRVGIDLFWGLVAMGLLAGSLPALMGPGEAPAAAVAALLGSGLIAVIVTLRYFLTPIIRKLRLKPWLERRWGQQPEDKPKK